MAGRIRTFALGAAATATALMPVAAQARPGWDGGRWNGRGWHRDRGIDGGDVLAGLLIIGGIAAIATAASNAEKKRKRDDEGYRYRPEDGRDDRSRPDWPTTNGGGQGIRGINDAVDACASEAERRGEIEEIYDATRQGDGYRVSGTLRNGDRFSCDVSAQGGVRLDLRRGGI